MRAAVVPVVNGKWKVKQWETPKAGLNQVVMKIHASGLRYTDVHITHGILPRSFPVCWATSRWARSWKLAPASPRAESETGSVSAGCKKATAPASGASAIH
jgi:hypothetical protein